MIVVDRCLGTNRLVKQVRHAACGFRNRDNYRQTSHALTRLPYGITELSVGGAFRAAH